MTSATGPVFADWSTRLAAAILAAAVETVETVWGGV